MNIIEEKKIQELANLHPWPLVKPDLPFNQGGWFPECNQAVLAGVLNADTKVVLELGAWIGLSTRWIADHAPNARVITIDHWLGSPENANDRLIPILYDQFVANCWNYRHRIIPVRLNTAKGVEQVKQLGLNLDVVYVDAGHDYDSAVRDIRMCTEFGCPLVGDDFNPNSWPGVVKAVWEEAIVAQRILQIRGSAWCMDKRW